MTFLRLNRWDWLAFVAALGLLVSMSTLWWSTHQADACRHASQVQTAPGINGPLSSGIDQKLTSEASRCEAKYDKTAWSASAFVDWLIKLALVAAIVLAVGAAYLRAAGRRFEPPWTPSTIAALTALAGGLLLLYRILQPPGNNDAAVIKPGAPIGLVLVGVLAIAARSAAAREEAEPAPAPDASAPPVAGTAEPGPPPADASPA